LGLWLFERSEFHRTRRWREAQGMSRDAGGFFCFVFLTAQENEKRHLIVLKLQLLGDGLP